MSHADRDLSNAEHIVYRGRFGSARLVYELIVIAIGLFIGALLGPGIILVILFLMAWLWDQRRLQEVVVTNKRLIHKRHFGRSNVQEMNLSKIESIKKQSGKMTVFGSGGSKIALPEFLADESSLRASMMNGATMPPLLENGSPHQAGRSPLWKRPIPITLFVVFVVLPLLGALLEDANKPSSVEQHHVASAPHQSAPAHIQDQLPVEVLSVKEADLMGAAKRSVQVRLQKPVDKATLTKIAHLIQNEKPNFRATYIEYLLDGMTSGAGAWATTHFDPTLNVQILGPSPEQLAEVKSDETSGVIGQWSGQAGTVITIKRAGNELHLIRSYDDGSEGRDRLSESKIPSGTRYDPIEDSNGTGDHYILRKDRNLELRDRFGLIFIAPAA